MLARAAEIDVLPTCQRYGMAVIPWSPLGGGWLSGKWRKGAQEMVSRRSGLLPWRYDLSFPGNERKLDATDALAGVADEAGITLPHLAVAWVLNHPAVTAPIIGPSTMEQLTSLLGAVDVVLETDVLDRIDDIVPPGTNFIAGDLGYVPPSLADPAERRR
jgi:aryl-alcohol dehydrogenase-like predicted oxidoreductase